MDPVTIALVLLGLVERLLPQITEMTKGGVISKETQEEIRARYDKLAGNMDEAFGGDHWKVRPDPEPQPSAAAKKGPSNC